MAWYHHWEIVRNIPAGDGINSVQVQAYRHSDDSTIGSPVTTSTVDGVIGSAQLLLATTVTTGTSFELHPGPYYLESTHNGVTRRKSSRDIGTSGPIDLFAQLFLNHAMGSGIVQNPPLGLNEMDCTSAGLARTVVVATGAGVIRGLPFFNHLARTVDIGANASGDPRIDTMVLELVPAGNATEGKLTLKVVAGTPAVTPVAPTLTQTTVLWQEPLCDVAVANGASVITQGNITDRRDMLERAVSNVEDDLSALEDRVETLEGPPRLKLIGWHSEIVNIGNMAANAGVSVTYTVANRVEPFVLSDMLHVQHFGFDNVSGLSIKGAIHPSNGTDVIVNYYNHNPFNFDPISASLHIWLLRPVTS